MRIVLKHFGYPSIRILVIEILAHLFSVSNEKFSLLFHSSFWETGHYEKKETEKSKNFHRVFSYSLNKKSNFFIKASMSGIFVMVWIVDGIIFHQFFHFFLNGFVIFIQIFDCHFLNFITFIQHLLEFFNFLFLFVKIFILNLTQFIL